jgi:hypothetical protein
MVCGLKFRTWLCFALSSSDWTAPQNLMELEVDRVEWESFG